MSRSNRNWRVWLALTLALGLALAPAMAAARAGRSFGSPGASFGRSGLRSYQPNGAQPLGRSATPPAPGLAPSGYGGGSFFRQHPFLTGLAGGFLGSWLFGHSGYAGNGVYRSSALGTLVELLLIGGLIYLAFRLIRGRAFSGGWPGAGPARLPGAGLAAAPRGRDVNLADGDLNAFQALHAAIQAAWSAGDLAGMRQLMTPEMVGYFSEELTRNASQGVQNLVSDIRFEKGELSEAWEEGDLQYASAALRWRARDYVVRLDGGPGTSGQIVSGDPHVPVEAEELWTFVRRRGGRWLLSAIQQV